MNRLDVRDPEWLGIGNPWQIAVENGPELVEYALQARESARSYRDFRVGVSGIALTQSGEMGIVTAANTKLSPDSTPYCAEQALLDQLEPRKFTWLAFVALVGPVQEDRHSGLIFPTLHPCGNCRKSLATSPHVRDSTIILSFDPEQQEYEMYNRRELLEIHDSVDKEDPPGVFESHQDPGFKTWRKGAMRFKNWFINALETGPVGEDFQHIAARSAVTGRLG